MTHLILLLMLQTAQPAPPINNAVTSSANVIPASAFEYHPDTITLPDGYAKRIVLQHKDGSQTIIELREGRIASTQEIAAPQILVTTAVEEEYGNLGWNFCDMTCAFIEGIPEATSGIKAFRRKRWTCSDKRRVLVTTEEGVHLCILFTETTVRPQ